MVHPVSTKMLVQKRIRQEEADRRRNSTVRHQMDTHIDAVMRTFDTDQSGKLEKAELTRVLEGMNDGCAVEEDEVEWLLRFCDANNDAGIDSTELREVITWWEHYRVCKPRLQALVRQYDVSRTGQLELPELQKVLTHLNDGTPVEESHAETVMQLCDVTNDKGLCASELLYAISVWYAAYGDSLSRRELSHIPSPPQNKGVAQVQEGKGAKRRVGGAQKKPAAGKQDGCACCVM